MYAYGKEYDAPRVILLYPRHGELPYHLADYRHCGAGQEKHIEVKTVDLRAPFARGNGRTHLRSMLRTMVMEQGVSPY